MTQIYKKLTEAERAKANGFNYWKPDPLEPTDKTIMTLFELASRAWGFEEEQVRNTLKGYGIAEFMREDWWMYIGLLRAEYEHIQAALVFPFECPVCQAPIERDEHNDFKFGAKWGWRCIVNHSHFMEAQWGRLKAAMVGRPSFTDTMPYERWDPETLTIVEGVI